MRLSLGRGCVTFWMVAHVSEWRAFTTYPTASLPQTPCPCVWQRRIGGIRGIGGESLFVLVRFVWVLLPVFFLFCPGEFKFGVNKNIFLKGGL